VRRPKPTKDEVVAPVEEKEEDHFKYQDMIRAASHLTIKDGYLEKMV
jgi:hypothetical protein